MMNLQEKTSARRFLDDTVPGRVGVLDGAFGIEPARIEETRLLTIQKILTAYVDTIDTLLRILPEAQPDGARFVPPSRLSDHIGGLIDTLKRAIALDLDYTEYLPQMREFLTGMEELSGTLHSVGGTGAAVELDSEPMKVLLRRMTTALREAADALKGRLPRLAAPMYKPGLEFKQSPKGLGIPTHFVANPTDSPFISPAQRKTGAESRGRIFCETIRPRLPAGADLATLFDLSKVDYLSTGSVGGSVATARINLGEFPSGFRFPEGEGGIGDSLANLTFYREAASATVAALLDEVAFVDGLGARLTSDFKDRGFSRLDPANAATGRINVSRRGIWGASRYDPSTEGDSALKSSEWRSGYIRNDGNGDKHFFVEDFCFRDPSTGEWQLSGIQGSLENEMERRRTQRNEVWVVLGEITSMRPASLGVRFLRRGEQLLLEMIATHYPVSTFHAATRVVSINEWKFFEPNMLPAYRRRGDLDPKGFPSVSPPQAPFSLPTDSAPEGSQAVLKALIEGVPPVHRQFGLPVGYKVMHDLNRFHPEVTSRAAVTFAA